MLYYGETIGFVFAWVAGVAALVAASSEDQAQRPSVDQIAAADVAPATAAEAEPAFGVR